MTDTISKKLESKIDNKLISKAKRSPLEDGFKKGKVVNEVLDKPTVMTLYKMITDHIIAYVNGSISAGKESVLFWGVDENDVNVALKIYLVSTSNFKKREPYIIGDPRFSHLKKGTKNLVYLWARKEFRNLSQCHDAGIPVPKPIYVTNNVLAMEFIGENGAPCKSLLVSDVDENDYNQAISILERLFVIHPNHEHIIAHRLLLARSYVMKGDLVDGVKNLEIAMKLNPGIKKVIIEDPTFEKLRALESFRTLVQ